MNLGTVCTLANQDPPNLTVVIFDNGIYECIGGPPTLTSKNADLARMAEGAGCINCDTVMDIAAFREKARALLTTQRSVRVEGGLCGNS